MKEHGVEPAPKRGRRTSWSTFLQAHWPGWAAIDFTTVEVLFVSFPRNATQLWTMIQSAPSYLEKPHLYARDPEIRLAASVAFQNNKPDIRLRWPFGHWGAANPWLVLLGPSPGNDQIRKRSAESDPFSETHLVGYGPNAQEVVFDDGKKQRRNKNWLLLRTAAFEAAGLSCDNAAQCQSKLSAIMNLGFETAATAVRDTEHDERRIAAFERTLLPCMAQARPAVIVVLSKAAWDPFENALALSNRIVAAYKAVPNLIPSATRKPMKRLLVRVADDLPFPTAVILSPVHPSMGFTRTVDDRSIIEPLRELLLAQVAL